MSSMWIHNYGLSRHPEFADQNLLHFDRFRERRLVRMNEPAGDDQEWCFLFVVAARRQTQSFSSPLRHIPGQPVGARSGDKDHGIGILLPASGPHSLNREPILAMLHRLEPAGFIS